ELLAYLRCGLLEPGCVRVRCLRCTDEMVVAFSCKGREFCPSCGGRRMSALAAQLVEHVIPHMPVRQWVLSLPWSLRYQLALDAPRCRDVLACSCAWCSPGSRPAPPARASATPVRGRHGDPALRVGLESESPPPLRRARRRVHAILPRGGACVSSPV